MALTLEEANRMVPGGHRQGRGTEREHEHCGLRRRGQFARVQPHARSQRRQRCGGPGEGSRRSRVWPAQRFITGGFSGNPVNHQLIGWADASGPGRSANPKRRRVGRRNWRQRRHGRAGRRLRQGGVGGPLAFTAPTAPSESAQSLEIAATQAIREPVQQAGVPHSSVN